jgi:hypothetical protein
LCWFHLGKVPIHLEFGISPKKWRKDWNSLKKVKTNDQLYVKAWTG